MPSKFLIVDECNRCVYRGDTFEEAIENYEDITGDSFKIEQCEYKYLIEVPEPIEVEFKIIRKDIPVINKPRK